MTDYFSFSSNNDSCFPELTYETRLKGFIGCTILGTLIQIMSMGSFYAVVLGQPGKFAFMFTLGNLVNIAGSGFLVGPQRQFKQMSDPSRRIASCVYITSIIAVLYAAMYSKSAVLVFLLIIIELCAYTWYSLSYIPYARACLQNFITSKFNFQ